MKKVMITVIEEKVVNMEKEISDDLYNALYNKEIFNGNYEQKTVFENLEDDCVDWLDSCELDDNDIDKNAGIIDVTDENGYTLYHYVEHLEY